MSRTKVEQHQLRGFARAVYPFDDKELSGEPMLTVTLHEEVSLRAYAWGLEESNISCRKEVRKRTAGETFGTLKPALSVLTPLFSGKFRSRTSKCAQPRDSGGPRPAKSGGIVRRYGWAGLLETSA